MRAFIKGYVVNSTLKKHTVYREGTCKPQRQHKIEQMCFNGRRNKNWKNVDEATSSSPGEKGDSQTFLGTWQLNQDLRRRKG